MEVLRGPYRMKMVEICRVLAAPPAMPWGAQVVQMHRGVLEYSKRLLLFG